MSEASRCVISDSRSLLCYPPIAGFRAAPSNHFSIGSLNSSCSLYCQTSMFSFHLVVSIVAVFDGKSRSLRRYRIESPELYRELLWSSSRSVIEATHCCSRSTIVSVAGSYAKLRSLVCESVDCCLSRRSVRDGQKIPYSMKLIRDLVRLSFPFGPPRTKFALWLSCPSSSHQQIWQMLK